MSTSPEFVRLLELLETHKPRPGAPVDELRTDVAPAQAKRPLAEGVTVEAVDAGGVPVEFVTSADCPAAGRVLMYLHGGGYILGSLDTARPFAATLADTARSRVLAVDYRLAPEFPYPAAIDDSAAAYR
jgi:epsilon-lactone hydrolase